MNKSVKRVIFNLLITLVFGFVYFYFKLPAINLHDPAFYSFFFLLALVYCILSVLSLGIYRAATVQEFWQALKKNCLVPVCICVFFLLLIVVGVVIGLPIFRAGSYSAKYPLWL